MLFNIGCAHHMSPSDVTRLNACYMKVVRDIGSARNHADFKSGKSDVQVLHELDLPSMRTLLSCAPLRFCRRLVSSDVPRAVRLAAMAARRKQNWTTLILSDFAWLASRFPQKFGHLQPPATDLKSWLNLVSDSKNWNRLLSSIVKHRDLVSNDVAIVDVSDSVISSFPCTSCDAVFASLSALCTHNYRVHHYRNPARYYIVHDTCAACLRKFHHRDDVFRHLAYGNQQCLQLLQRIYLPMPHSAVCELDDAAVASRKDRAASRCPRPPPCKELRPLLHPDILQVRQQLYQFG